MFKAEMFEKYGLSWFMPCCTIRVHHIFTGLCIIYSYVTMYSSINHTSLLSSTVANDFLAYYNNIWRLNYTAMFNFDFI